MVDRVRSPVFLTSVSAARVMAPLTWAALALELRNSGDYIAIPEYAYDCHTREGKKRGKTKADFFKAEQAALEPLQPGLFDHLID